MSNNLDALVWTDGIDLLEDINPMPAWKGFWSSVRSGLQFLEIKNIEQRKRLGRNWKKDSSGVFFHHLSEFSTAKHGGHFSTIVCKSHPRFIITCNYKACRVDIVRSNARGGNGGCGGGGLSKCGDDGGG